MANEMTGIGVAGIPVRVDCARASLYWAVVVDDNLIHAEDTQCSGYPARTCNPLVCGLKAGLGQLPLLGLAHGKTCELTL